MQEQFDLFQNNNSTRFAIIFCSCVMEDQFGEVWCRKEIYKSNLPEDVAVYLTNKLNETESSFTSFYEAVPEVGPNFLIT